MNSTHSPCAHCGLPLPPRPVTAEGRDFCCSACSLVFAAIHAAGLDAYYERRDRDPLSPPDAPDDCAALDRPEVCARYARPATDGALEAALLVDGIHCAACCWLIENAVGRLPGVHEARVNYATSRIRVRWDPARHTLGDVARRIAAVGYRATPYEPGGHEQRRTHAQRDLVLRLVVAGIATLNVMMVTDPLYAGVAVEEVRGAFHWVALLASSAALLYSAAPFFRGASRGLAHGVVTMDLPVALGLVATYGYSAWATLSGRGDVYFDSVGMLVFVLLAGRALEGASRGRVTAAVERLLTLAPATAVRARDGRLEEVAADSLVPGDEVEVADGRRVPADGVVVDGGGWVDESMLSGEAAAVEKSPGDEVTGATVLVDGRLRVRLTRTGADTALARIARMCEDAQARRARVQRITDRAAAFTVVATLVLAALAAFLWIGHGVEAAVRVAAAVLIVTCPCALGLATPLAVSAAVGRGAAEGVLFRGGDALEALQGVTHVVLDKTGTLTEGRMALARTLTAAGEDPAELLRLAAALEQTSSHPVGRALVAACDASVLPAVDDLQIVPGAGLRGRVEGLEVAVGTRGFACAPHPDRACQARPAPLSPDLDRACQATLSGTGQAQPAPLPAPPDLRLLADAASCEAVGQTVVWIAVEGRLKGAFAVSDRLRPEAAEVVAALQAKGIEVLLASGDRPVVAEEMARRAGISAVHAGMRPDEKAAFVEDLRRRGARVAFVGDGVNDAPALSAATVGIGVARGADIATEAAAVVLLRPGLRGLPHALRLAERARAVIRDNLLVSALYNLIAVPAALAGWVTPLAAAVAMPLSSLGVVASSLRLWNQEGQ